MDILDQTLIWNRQGIIQGPDESDAVFIKRAHYLEQFKSKIKHSLEISDEEEKKGDLILKESFTKAAAFYHIEPSFVPIFFSNKQLSFFHGGAAWIVQIEDDSPTGAFIQLKKSYLYKDKILCYKREEILVHELAHIGRMAYDCPVFEEVLAWSSSKNRFRRFFGPLFVSLKETSLFAFLLITLFIMDILAIFFGDESLFQTLQYLKLIPLTYLLYAGIRLFFKQRTFASCLFKLQALLGTENARFVMYRLSDQEISIFSKKTSDSILSYINTNAKKSLRWKTLHKAYGFESS